MEMTIPHHEFRYKLGIGYTSTLVGRYIALIILMILEHIA